MQMPSNPAQLMQFMQGGGNPMSLLQQAAGQNPMAANVLNALNAKSMTPQQIAENLCKAQGVTPQEFVKRLGIPL